MPQTLGTPTALAGRVRQTVVLGGQQARNLLEAAARQDVGRGGCFAAGPAGVQVWSGPFDGPGGTKGSAVHLGSLDWTRDQPVAGSVTIHGVMVTSAGVDRGETAASISARVLALAGAEAQPV
jgi:hypothetical protein